MVDIENFIFSKVKEKILSVRPNARVISTDVQSEAFKNTSLVISIIEVSNTVETKFITRGRIENYSHLMYEVNVYSNRQDTQYGTKRQEAKQFNNIVSEAFAELGFVRTMSGPVPNLADGTIYRITSRYEGVSNQTGTIYTS